MGTDGEGLGATVYSPSITIIAFSTVLIAVRLVRSVENMDEDKSLPRRLEKGITGVSICGYEKPESYFVKFFKGNEPWMDDYLGFCFVKPEDIDLNQ